MKTKHIHWEISLLISMFFFIPTAQGMGSDHPNKYPIKLDRAPEVLEALINSEGRVHGFWVNSEDVLFYSGDTAACQAFIDKYAAIKEIPYHKLTIHRGKGRAKSPWDNGPGKPCDWKLYVAIPIPGSSRDIPKIPPDPIETPKPDSDHVQRIAEIEVWADGNIDTKKLKVPENVAIVKDEPEDKNQRK